MYNPKFKKTDYLLFLLSEIKVLQKAISEAPIIPQWEVKLRQEAFLRSTHASTSIEGNSLTLDEVSQVLLDRKNIGIRREQQEVKNYYQTLTQLNQLQEKSLLEIEDILTIHQWIMAGLGGKNKTGAWRSGDVVVGNRQTGWITYQAPAAGQVSQLVEDLVDWYNHQEQYFSAILKAGIVHYRMVWVHPFADGNGRTARALATLVLLKEKFDIKRFFTLDDYYDADRALYFGTIQKTNDSEDLTEWLVYFSEGLLQSLQAIDRQIKKLNQITPASQKDRQLEINQREERILWLIEQKKDIQSRDVQGELDISRQAAHKLLVKMIEKGLLERTGGGRSVRYQLRKG